MHYNIEGNTRRTKLLLQAESDLFFLYDSVLNVHEIHHAFMMI